MTGLERLIAKVSNATTQAMLGQPVGVVSRSWGLAENRLQALDDLDYQTRRRAFEEERRTRRRLVHFGCE